MKTLVQLLNESKQVGTIYHYTMFKNGYMIVKYNQLKSVETVDSTKDNLLYGVSFTRDKQFHKKNVVNFHDSPFGNDPQVRFTIDGDKLSTKYKIQPFAQTTRPEFLKGGRNFEAEERAVSKKQFTIPILTYLKSIDMLVEYPKPPKSTYYKDDEWDDKLWLHNNYQPWRDQLIIYAQQNNIPINLIVNKNGDPWPDKAQKTIIDKIVQWFKK